MKRRRYLFASCMVGLLLVIAWLLFWKDAGGSQFHGKTVKAWLSTVKSSDSILWTPEIVLMLDTLGSNAAPSLIEILDRDKTPIKDWFSIQAIKAKWLPNVISSVAANYLHESAVLPSHAERAIEYLGTNAICAIPELERIVCDPGKERGWPMAAMALAKMGLASRPALQRSITNAPISRRAVIERMLKSLE